MNLQPSAMKNQNEIGKLVETARAKASCLPQLRPETPKPSSNRPSRPTPPQVYTVELATALRAASAAAKKAVTGQ